ncbi:MAG: universal stress protein [Paracoccus sp. (in: a-proteobacteria)]|uniref:universal stress protein n=1 Tax=Paracoccus sp. TaxID=267 RepID=UPI0039E5E6F1
MRNLLIASDLSSRSQAALGRALALAEAGTGETRLSVLHVADDAGPDDGAGPELRVQAFGRQDNRPDLALIRRHGDPDAVIAQVAHELGAALVLMGVPRPRRFPDALSGTTAERVLNDSALPVAVIRNPPEQPWRRILIALEDDDGAIPLVAAAEALDLFAGADVTVLSATNLPGPQQLRTTGLSEIYLQTLDMHATEERGQALRRRLRDHFQGVNRLDFALRHGAPGQAILDLQANEGFDLVIMGARGRGRLARRLLGSTSAEMIRLLDTDLICLPSPHP